MFIEISIPLKNISEMLSEFECQSVPLSFHSRWPWLREKTLCRPPLSVCVEGIPWSSNSTTSCHLHNKINVASLFFNKGIIWGSEVSISFPHSSFSFKFCCQNLRPPCSKQKLFLPCLRSLERKCCNMKQEKVPGSHVTADLSAICR